MKTNPNDCVTALMELPDSRSIVGGLTKRELMAIEFTKTLLGLRHYDNQPIYDLTKHEYSANNEFCMFNSQEQADKQRFEEVDRLTEKALYVADSLIEALNKEEQ